MEKFRTETGQSKQPTFARPMTDSVMNVVLAAGAAAYVDIPADIGVSSIGGANTDPRYGRVGIAIFGADNNFWILKNGVSGTNPIAVPSSNTTAGANPICNPGVLAIDKDVSSLGLISESATKISIEFSIA